MRVFLSVSLLLLVGCGDAGPASRNTSPAGDAGRVDQNNAGSQPARDGQPSANRGATLLPRLAELEPAPAMRDLSQIDRSIGEQPQYESDEPKYCLLVLGPERKTQVLLVLDGHTLYADQNLDGRIDESSEKFSITDTKCDPTNFESFTILDGNDPYEVKVGLWSWFANQSGASGQRTHQSINVTSRDGMRFIAWGDHHSSLKFHASIVDAPVVYIAGPLQMGFEIRQPFDRKDKDELEISMAVGTFGLGDGSFSSMIYSVVPDTVFPNVTVTIPSKVKVNLRR